MKIYQAVERHPTLIPIGEVLAADGTVAIFPEVRDKGYFDLDFRDGKLVVVSGKFIGHVPLTPDLVVDVRPKVGITRLAHILERSREPLRCLDFFRRAYKTDEFVGDSIFEVLVRALVGAVENIVSEGLLLRYAQHTRCLPTIRGRVRVLETVKHSHSRGLYSQVTCSYFESSRDGPLNRLIKYALWYSAKHMAERSLNAALLRRVVDLYDSFGSVPLDLSMGFIREAHEYLSRNRLPSIRQYYIEACDVAFTVIADSGLELLSEGRDVHLASFLVNLETVFEQYVRNVLGDALREVGIDVLDGNKEGMGRFFRDNRDHDAKPDLVFKRANLTVAIGDVKYKPKISEADRYQLVSHAICFGVNRAIVVMPAASGKACGLRRLGRVGGQGGVDIFVYEINLESTDLYVEEGAMVREFDRLLAQEIGS